MTQKKLNGLLVCYTVKCSTQKRSRRKQLLFLCILLLLLLFFFCNLFTHGTLRSSLELVETCPSDPDRIQVIKKHFRMDRLPNFSSLWGFHKKQTDTKSQMPIAYLQRVFDCFLIPRMKRVDNLPELRRSPLEMNLVAKIQEKPNVSRSERAIQVHAMVKVVKQTNH